MGIGKIMQLRQDIGILENKRDTLSKEADKPVQDRTQSINEITNLYGEVLVELAKKRKELKFYEISNFKA